MRRNWSISVACLVAVSLVWLTGCTKDVEANFDCPASVVAGETFFVSNYSLNAYSYIWEFGDRSHVSASDSYETALAALSAVSFSSVLGDDSKEDYEYYIGYCPDLISFKYAGEKKIILHAYSKNGKKSSHKTKYVTVSKPSSYTITYLELQQIRLSSWDTGVSSGIEPDIYFKITETNGSELYTSATKYNVGELPVKWQVNTTLDSKSTYSIEFYDYDELDSDDNMANCIFESSYMSFGSSSYTWVASIGSIKFTVGLDW
jgi:hypothetical protein